jgi:hypothetical protein
MAARSIAKMDMHPKAVPFRDRSFMPATSVRRMADRRAGKPCLQRNLSRNVTRWCDNCC